MPVLQSFSKVVGTHVFSIHDLLYAKQNAQYDPTFNRERGRFRETNVYLGHLHVLQF